jgi:two-component system response regulator (stage 0 sporulation protein A)
VNEVTTTKVERANRGNLDTLQRYFGYTVSNIKGKPANTEFISIIADRIRLWMKENADLLK